jgi:hypothetical protein
MVVLESLLPSFTTLPRDETAMALPVPPLQLQRKAARLPHQPSVSDDGAKAAFYSCLMLV